MINDMTGKQSRRGFVKKSAQAVATGITFSALPIAGHAYVAAKDEIKVSVVGCGGRGTGAAAQAIEADPGVRLVALADIFADQVEKSFKGLSAKYGQSGQMKITEVSKYVGLDAYKKAIDAADVVILATPPGFRPQHFEYAINQGKHVFMEKPVATDVAGVKKVLDAGKTAEKKKLNVVVGLQRHYQQNYRTVADMVKKGKVGDIISGQVYWNGAGVWVRPRQEKQTELEYQLRNWYYFNWICGDHILEQHIHNIDVASWLIGGQPVSAQGMGGREVRKGKDHGQIFDHHFVEFEYGNGTIISSQCRHQKDCMNRVEEVLQGTKGSIRLTGGNVGIVKSRSGKTLYEHDSTNDRNPYQQEHDELFAAVRKGEYNLNDTKVGAESTMAAILGRMATYSGQLITWEEAMATDLKLVPELNSLDDEAPVLPDAEGKYPVPVPGVTRFT